MSCLDNGFCVVVEQRNVRVWLTRPHLIWCDDEEAGDTDDTDDDIEEDEQDEDMED